MRTNDKNMEMMKKFNEVVERYMGMNPQYPYWLLFILYLRKNNRLRIETNYDGDDYNVLACIDLSFVGQCTSLETVSKWKRDGIVNQCLIGDYVKDSIEHSLYQELLNITENDSSFSFLDEKSKFLETLFSFKQWDPAVLMTVGRDLIEMPNYWVAENFAFLFDNMLSRIFFRYKIEFIQPDEITKIASSLLQYNGGTIYNPFAGLASYGVELKAGDDCICQEINHKIATLAKLRLLANDGNPLSVYEEDSFKNIPNNFDYLISTPPLGLKNAFPHFIELSKSCINRSVGVFACGVLFSKLDERVRRSVVDRDLVEMVIQLPGNIFDNTQIPVCVIVLNSQKVHNGYVKFIDASDCFIKDNRKNVVNVEDVLSLTRENSVPQKVVLVSNDEILDNETSLSVNYYLAKNMDVPKGYNLVDITELGYFITNRTTPDRTYKCASIKDFSNTLDLRVRTSVDFNGTTTSLRPILVDEDAILISCIDSLKPTLFSVGDSPIVLSNFTQAFAVDKSRVVPAYLAIELSKDYVLKQVKKGAVVQHVSLSELRRIKVRVPSFEKQRELVSEFQTELIKKLGIQITQQKEVLLEEYKKELRIRKHAIEQVMNRIIPSCMVFRKFLNNENNIDFKNATIPFLNYSVEHFLNKLETNINLVDELVKDLTFDFDFYPAENIDVVKCVEEYQQREMGGEDNKFRIEVRNRTGQNPEISISKKDFGQMLDNIMSNAKTKGFVNPERKDYCVMITIELSEQSVCLRISNNGELLPKGITPEQVFTWGVGSGTGIGGYHTKMIVEHFGGEISFHQYDNAIDGHNIEYVILFPNVKEK